MTLMLQRVVVAIVKLPTPRAALRYPPLTQLFMIACPSEELAILEQVQVNGEAQLVAGGCVAIPLEHANLSMRPWISEGVTQGDFVSEFNRLVDQARNHPGEAALLLTQCLAHLLGPCRNAAQAV